jgi:hypothetical protein
MTRKVSRARDLIAGATCDCVQVPCTQLGRLAEHATQSQARLAIDLARWRMLLQVASGIAGGFIGRQPVTTTTCCERDCSKIFHFTCPVVQDSKESCKRSFLTRKEGRKKKGMVIRCRIRRRKTFWVLGACVGTLRAMEEETGHDRASQNLLKRLPPAESSCRYATSTLGPGRLAFPIGKKPLVPYGESLLVIVVPTNYRQR